MIFDVLWLEQLRHFPLGLIFGMACFMSILLYVISVVLFTVGVNIS